MKTTKILGLMLILTLVSACASITVRDEDLQEKAAQALGVNANRVVISNRDNNGATTTFTATVGKRAYLCSVTGSVSIEGRNVSNATCNK